MILVVEQNAQLALELADKAYVIETGRIVMSSADGTNNEDVRKSITGISRAFHASGDMRAAISYPPAGRVGMHCAKRDTRRGGCAAARPSGWGADEQSPTRRFGLRLRRPLPPGEDKGSSPSLLKSLTKGTAMGSDQPDPGRHRHRRDLCLHGAGGGDDLPNDRHLNFAQRNGVFSTFVAWQLMQWGLPYWIAFVITLAFSFCGGILIERALFKPLAKAPILTHVAGSSRCTRSSTASPD